MSLRLLTVLVTALIVLIQMSMFTPGSALATPKGGSVTGTVDLGEDKRKRPLASKGFVNRRENVIAPAQPFDPRDEVIVVLVDGTVADDDKEAPRQGARYNLRGESFEMPLKPIQLGTEVDIKNLGINTPQLYSPDDAELLDADPVQPKATRSITVKTAFKTFRIMDRDSAHLIGRVVAFPHPYFSRVVNGKYEIDGVPAGKWKLRLWYRNGWVKGSDQTVEVVARKARKVNAITLPIELEAKAETAKSERKEP